jgi:hypothetical protein
MLPSVSLEITSDWCRVERLHEQRAEMLTKTEVDELRRGRLLNGNPSGDS